jgi:hypothetical protein
MHDRGDRFQLEEEGEEEEEEEEEEEFSKISEITYAENLNEWFENVCRISHRFVYINTRILAAHHAHCSFYTKLYSIAPDILDDYWH